ncbi:50S ribosomal protein L18 [Candidatus Similichlamydia laticola]|uniref:Large ribosomal subunit protein uL18 n=1 Tax=Candidatus Similichlamydia laticola TaxID=2170265 RepID=A0A369KHX3_9BACT|nr:50S ribosomal protein L18 [Candidatus Similichlamydia laticola]RDB31393.1 LSU ribosomal protein L18p (L5e) [Candidatus Similichlamydia laticola]
MESQQKQKVRRRYTRSLRVRRKVRTVGEAYPRLCVFKSNRHLSVQLIDDDSGKTLCSSSTMSPSMRKRFPTGKGRAAAECVGRSIAESALALGCSRVVFDRGHRAYHGLVQLIAESARSAGLQF